MSGFAGSCSSQWLVGLWMQAQFRHRQHCLNQCMNSGYRMPYSYFSSQLYMDRAKVVSMCLMASFCNHLSVLSQLWSWGGRMYLEFFWGVEWFWRLWYEVSGGEGQPRFLCLHSSSNFENNVSNWTRWGLSITNAARCGSGIEASTALISAGPKPVTVLLCLGLVKPGPTGPWSSERGALIEGLRSLAMEGLLSGRGRSVEAPEAMMAVRGGVD